VGDRGEVVEAVLHAIRPGDLVLTLGAGDIGAVADQLRERLTASPTPDSPLSGEGDLHAG